jgi:hypothetical protein
LPHKKKTMPSKHFAILFVLIITLSGCAAPPALQILSLALDGISYIATDKTLTDHGLSALTQKDCKLFRTLEEKEVCIEEKTPAPMDTDVKLLAEKPNEPKVR